MHPQRNDMNIVLTLFLASVFVWQNKSAILRVKLKWKSIFISLFLKDLSVDFCTKDFGSVLWLDLIKYKYVRMYHCSKCLTGKCLNNYFELRVATIIFQESQRYSTYHVYEIIVSARVLCTFLVPFLHHEQQLIATKEANTPASKTRTHNAVSMTVISEAATLGWTVSSTCLFREINGRKKINSWMKYTDVVSQELNTKEKLNIGQSLIILFSDFTLNRCRPTIWNLDYWKNLKIHLKTPMCLNPKHLLVSVH